VTLLLATWSDWSILTTNYLCGLEMAFFESEVDFQSAQSILRSSEAPDTDVAQSDADIASLRRQCRLAGVYFDSRKASKAYLVHRLQQVANYAKLKMKKSKNSVLGLISSGFIGLSAHANKDTGGNADEDDDIDGVELDYDPLAFPAANASTNADKATVDDEDIDGVVMADANEDVDGVPFDDDIDGVPL
jgi:hypothetical protein